MCVLWTEVREVGGTKLRTGMMRRQSLIERVLQGQSNKRKGWGCWVGGVVCVTGPLCTGAFHTFVEETLTEFYKQYGKQKITGATT